MKGKIFIFAAAALLAASCGAGIHGGRPDRVEEPSFFEFTDDAVITISPYDGSRDTLVVDRPFGRIICMSSNYVAYLDAIGCDSVICGVSGAGFISSPLLGSRIADGEVQDVGYDDSPDYEKVLTLKPDLYVTYNLSASDTPAIARLKELGINVLTLYDHLEEHPLARAAYVRLFGKLTGKLDRADSLYSEIEAAYMSLRRDEVSVKVLVNIPYRDQWFVPGGDSYMTCLIRDAGGVVLGAKEGESASSVISVEQAYLLAGEADIWLNTGWCSTREQLMSVNPVFGKFDVPRIYNNTLRMNRQGGNDFWESGAVRPDLILEDLVNIFEKRDTLFHYYIEVR